ncbi:MAG TPA: choice-of-anchor Q domain-containing protein, partial [Rubrobacteraceae bacterium]|nr:choice-of-anchor Q domain-containing protein [Rubrobacteraceae bacterium]
MIGSVTDKAASWVGRMRRTIVSIAALAASLLLMMVAGPAWADTFTVTNTNDSGAGSLGAAITEANANTGADEITFADGVGGTITLASTLPTVTDPEGLTIDGGQSASVTISGRDHVGVFEVEAGAELALLNLTVADGSVAGNGGGLLNDGTLTVTNSTFSENSADGLGGGGIFNSPSGTLTVTNSTFSQNINFGFNNFGGGIFNSPGGTLTVTNSTFSENITDGFGGGIFNSLSGTLTVTNSTFSNNNADGAGGGIFNEGQSTATLRNTIVANSISGGNCAGDAITDGGYNIDDGTSCGFSTTDNSLSDVAPMLGPLADNGGPTLTHALLEGSPAINAIPEGTNGCGTTITTDQRGVTRPQGSGCDIGAFETQAPTANDDPTTAGDPKYSVDQDGSLTLSASDGVLANDTDPDDNPLTALKVTDPTNGTLTLSPDGSFTYTPRAGFSGIDSFTYKANDGTNDSNVATVTLTVNPETTAPTVSSVTPTKTTGVSRTPIITATFSEPVDKATVE